MIAARLDRPITIQQYSETADSYGEPIKTWTTLVETFAGIKQQSAKELFSAGKISETDIVFTTRYVSGVTAKDRILYDGKYYYLTGEPRELGRQDGLEIAAKVQE